MITTIIILSALLAISVALNILQHIRKKNESNENMRFFSLGFGSMISMKEWDRRVKRERRQLERDINRITK